MHPSRRSQQLLTFQLVDPSRWSERIYNFHSRNSSRCLERILNFEFLNPSRRSGGILKFSIFEPFTSFETNEQHDPSSSSSRQGSRILVLVRIFCTHVMSIRMTTSSPLAWIHAFHTYTRPHERYVARLCSLIDLTIHVYFEATTPNSRSDAVRCDECRATMAPVRLGSSLLSKGLTTSTTRLRQ